MSGLLEVVQPGIGTTVQDRGRPGHRHHGLPLSGWMDGPLAQAANALLGNPLHAAVLELRGVGTVFKVVKGPVRVALAGRVGAIRLGADGARSALPAWHSATLREGDLLQLGAAESGCAYLAVSGGIDLALAFGSRSSYWRAGLSGVLGRPFQPGDRLPCRSDAGTDPREWRSRSPWDGSQGTVRVVPGPQDDHFPPAAIASFFAQEWQATAAQDRMGLRLQGEPLAHLSPATADIVSDGVTPGAIQVPANGQPIVLLADGQTVGGYPKIATIISADLPRLAHLRPGTRIRFEPVTLAQAHQALQAERQRWVHWLASRETFLPPGTVDDAALYGSNLISGMLATQPGEDTP
ncbi:biotin-dependent carboxyltransferase family protein [Hydrogenophaga sp. RWCD_12]|uniref:5-oxoprolinase subunit C family protein n=1 Tax=Hydrogenophaga sp. RWCD_12 TaxID=3391190 RepID=UPI003984A892